MHINYLAVLVAGVAIFMLGGLWYSPVLFAKRWVALQGKTMAEMESMRAGPGQYVQVFLCGLLISAVLAVIMAHVGPDQRPYPIVHGVLIAVMTWLVAAATSYATALFSYKPRALWVIDTGYNLVSMVVAGLIIGAWQ